MHIVFMVFVVKIQHKLTTNDNNVRAHLCPNKFSHQKNFELQLKY